MSSFPERGARYNPEVFLRMSGLVDESLINRESKKVIDEGVAVANFLIGVSRLLSEENVEMQMLWQGVDRAPDARVFIGSGEYPLEVVCYTPYSLRSGESAKKLLERTKLSKMMNYPSDTILLCHVWPDLWRSQKSIVDRYIMNSARKPYSLFLLYDLGKDMFGNDLKLIQSVNGWRSISPGMMFENHNVYLTDVT